MVFGLLGLVSGGLLTWGEQWMGKRTFQAVVFLVFGTFIIGTCVRAGLQDKLDKNHQEK